MKWALLLLLFLSASLAASPYLVIDLDKGSLSINSGEQDELQVSIRNPNQAEVTLTISLIGEINTWGTLTESELTIAPGEIEATTLYVGAPKSSVAGTYGMIISASGEIEGETGEEHVQESKAFSVRVRTNEKFVLSFQKDHTVRDPGDTLKLTIDIENAGNTNYGMSLVTKVGELAVDERKVDLGPLTAQTLIIPFEISNKIPPGENPVTVSLVAGKQTIISEEEIITINPISDLSFDTDDDKGFWHREIIFTLENRGNTRESKDVELKLSGLEHAFMSASLTPTTTHGSDLVWQVALLPGENITISILTYGSVLYVAYLLVLTIIILSGYLTYTKVINKPPIELEKSVIGIIRKDKNGEGAGEKNEVVVGLYLKNTSGKKFNSVTLTDSVSKAYSVKKFESISPDQVNERDESTEYIWNFKEMKPFEERAIVYHMDGSGPISMKPANIRFQSGNKTYFKKTGKVAVTG